VKAFKGELNLKGNTLTFLFTDYLDNNQQWITLAGTDMAGTIENMIYSIKGDNLKMYVVNNKKVYIYKKIR